MELHRRLLRAIDDSAEALKLPPFLQVIYSVRMLERLKFRELYFKLELCAATPFVCEEMVTHLS